MNFIYLGIFIVFSCVHLFASYKQDKNLRAISKPVLLLSLLGFYIETVSNPSWFVILALLFSWLGDVLLIPQGVKWFTAGGISFSVSHVFFVLAYVNVTDFNEVPLISIIIFAIIFVGLVVYILFKLKPHLPKALFYPMIAYLLANGAMNCFAIYRLISCFSLGSIITVLGAFLFFVSDSTLFFVRFKKDSKIKTHFPVMITYLLGELLIIVGLVL